MSARIINLVLTLFCTTICAEIKSPLINGLDLPADPVPIKIQFFTTHNSNTYNIGQNSFPVSCDSGKNEWYAIRTKSAGLALDASEPNLIKLQHFTGFPQQLWKFERAGKPGVYYIVSNHTGGALDVDKDSIEHKWTAVLRPKKGSLNQKWITSYNDTIRNVGTGLMLDVVGGIQVAGNFLNVWEENGKAAQDFTLQEKPNT